MLLLCIVAILFAAACAGLYVGDNDHNMAIDVDMNTGAAQISVHQQPWLDLMGGLQVAGLGQLHLVSSHITSNLTDEHFGPFVNVTFVWKKHAGFCMETTFSVFEQHEMIIFDQYWKNGWVKSPIENSSMIVAS